MALADLSVNGGGSSCWELACLGVPMVILALSSDQQGNARALEDGGVAVRAHPGSPDSTARTVEALLVDVSRRRAMSTRASTLVDGMGAARAAQSLAETISQPRRH
jgi:spore coat polysaccharide biosynthesis predicted glycosyltransferase SpsG